MIPASHPLHERERQKSTPLATEAMHRPLGVALSSLSARVQAQSRGFTIHYEARGAGPPLVLVPGTLSSAAQWELFGYVDMLCERYRVISVDPLGHGAQ